VLTIESRPEVFQVNTEDFIWLELSLVKSVECVVVERTDDGKQFSVTVIVNERDPKIRHEIYERQKAIIDAHPYLYFGFYVQPRLNRGMCEFIGNGEGHSRNTTVFHIK
jgi:hypothetical protein